jgi:hypothetical protein
MFISLCLSTVWGVFIGTRWVAYPCQKHLDPRVPDLSPEYSHKMKVIDSHYGILYYRHGLIHACPRGTQFCGPNRTWASLRGEGVGGPVVFDGAFELSRQSEGVEQASVWSAPLVCPAGLADAVFICSMRGGSRRAKGGVFAYVPTFAIRETSSIKSAGVEDHREMVKTLPSLEVVPRGVLKCDR